MGSITPETLEGVLGQVLTEDYVRRIDFSVPSPFQQQGREGGASVLLGTPIPYLDTTSTPYTNVVSDQFWNNLQSGVSSEEGQTEQRPQIKIENVRGDRTLFSGLLLKVPITSLSQVSPTQGYVPNLIRS